MNDFLDILSPFFLQHFIAEHIWDDLITTSNKKYWILLTSLILPPICYHFAESIIFMTI